jgi:hypothetical protein
MPSQKFVRGLKIRHEVLGDEYVDKAMKNPWKYAADFHELVTEVVWGSVWDRPGPDSKGAQPDNARNHRRIESTRA